jgi:SAM-dependent methyltransferase
VVDGVAVLVDEHKSLFGAALEASSAAEARQTDLTARAKSAVRRILNVLPAGSRNVAALANYRRFRDLLHEQAAELGRPVRLLVVGGGVTGAGADELLSAAELRIVETDVYFGPRVQIVCDGHDLPFADGSFDAVVCQAVLEHVIDPSRCAAEIWRVLGARGYLYSEIPFMQQVHGGAYDFTRFTMLGHRRLWRYFDEVSSGVSGGPGMVLVWSIAFFLHALLPKRLAGAGGRLATLCFFWLTYLDDRLARLPAGEDAASGTFFMGRRRETATDDKTIVAGYTGAGKRYTPAP